MLSTRKKVAASLLMIVNGRWRRSNSASFFVDEDVACCESFLQRLAGSHERASLITEKCERKVQTKRYERVTAEERIGEQCATRNAGS